MICRVKAVSAIANKFKSVSWNDEVDMKLFPIPPDASLDPYDYYSPNMKEGSTCFTTSQKLQDICYLQNAAN